MFRTAGGDTEISCETSFKKWLVVQPKPIQDLELFYPPLGAMLHPAKNTFALDGSDGQIRKGSCGDGSLMQWRLGILHVMCRVSCNLRLIFVRSTQRETNVVISLPWVLSGEHRAILGPCWGKLGLSWGHLGSSSGDLGTE